MLHTQNDSVLLNCRPNAFNLEHCLSLIKTKVRTDNWSKVAIEKKNHFVCIPTKLSDFLFLPGLYLKLRYGCMFENFSFMGKKQFRKRPGIKWMGFCVIFIIPRLV